MSITLSSQQQLVINDASPRLQVIACAGSGKTEAMARRVVRLLASGVPPHAVAAFTFTKRAADSLKARVLLRYEEQLGAAAARRVGPLFIGTIHSYCFRLLQEHVSRYGGYDLLDDHRLAALLSREHHRLGLGALGDRFWAPLRDFLRNVAAVENELIAVDKLSPPFADCYRRFAETLDRYHFLTYGRIITEAVEAMQQPAVAAAVRAELRHLIVDEYQDVNAAQEHLIALLAAKPVELCVVGDDDQAIYQWRGSDVRNIIGFAKRYSGAAEASLSVNRRSAAEIIGVAGHFVESVQPRLGKQIRAGRPKTGFPPYFWAAETPQDEAEAIADHIARLHSQGRPYRDVAVLFRAVRTSAPPLLEALGRRGIPFSCAGRTGLFLQPEAELFGHAYAWLSDNRWSGGGAEGERPVSLDELLSLFGSCFELTGAARAGLRKRLNDWFEAAHDDGATANLVGDYYRLLRALGVAEWNLDDPATAARMGTLARFSQLLADFEHARRRARPVEEDGKQIQRGGTRGGRWLYRNLFNYMRFYARDAYEDFPGEDNPTVDAVDVLTVHQAKGLEWPVVFVPCMTKRRFPSTMSGRTQRWLLPDAAFPKAVRERYEGSETDERRLFYVAMTRARDALYVSHFRRMKNRTGPSPFFDECAGGNTGAAPLPLPPRREPLNAEVPQLSVSYSDLAAYSGCPLSYRMRALLGFQPQLAEEIGYGRAVHGILRRLAEETRATGRPPTEADAVRVIDAEFYLPFANRSQFEQMKRSAVALVRQYLAQFSSDLLRTWDTERPFDLRLPGASIQGRADVILDREGGTPGSLALVDYKTAGDSGDGDLFAFQLAIYAAAARDEGLDVRAAYLHELSPRSATRRKISVDGGEIQKAVGRASDLTARIANRRFPPAAEKQRCARCDVRPLCRHGAAG